MLFSRAWHAGTSIALCRDAGDWRVECQRGLDRIKVLAQMGDASVTRCQEDDILLLVDAARFGDPSFGAHPCNGLMRIVACSDFNIEEAEMGDGTLEPVRMPMSCALYQL